MSSLKAEVQESPTVNNENIITPLGKGSSKTDFAVLALGKTSYISIHPSIKNGDTVGTCFIFWN